jgi:hypothetical protein
MAEELLDSAPLFLTGNTDTVYAAGLLDLERLYGPLEPWFDQTSGSPTTSNASADVADRSRPPADRPPPPPELKRATSLSATTSPGLFSRSIFIRAGCSHPLVDAHLKAAPPSAPVVLPTEAIERRPTQHHGSNSPLSITRLGHDIPI